MINLVTNVQICLIGIVLLQISPSLGCGVDSCINGECNAANTTCVCDSGWSGVNCDTCDTCIHGNCSAINGTCECEYGWTGAACDTCEEGLRCGNGNCTQGQCICDNGWTGDACDTCAGQSCVNGYCAIDGSGCECQAPWSGELCERCGRSLCTHGQCESSMGEGRNSISTCDITGCVTCTCYAGFYGIDCEDTEDDTADSSSNKPVNLHPSLFSLVHVVYAQLVYRGLQY